MISFKITTHRAENKPSYGHFDRKVKKSMSIKRKREKKQKFQNQIGSWGFKKQMTQVHLFLMQYLLFLDVAKQIPKRFTRSYFPDTWLFEVVPVGSDGHAVLNRTTPHSITRWVTDAFCLGKNGLDSVIDVELTTFQPYFIDLIVPSSVVQGEKFTIEALVFSYEKECILIVASLTDSEDLITAQDKEQARCVCEGHSHRFTWDVSAVKLKTLKIHVDSGSLDVEGDCNEDVLLVGQDLRTDSVEKTVEIKPKGYEDERTKTFLLFPADSSEDIAININVPARLVPGSERAHIIVMGDLLANVIPNWTNWSTCLMDVENRI
ncbi:unnamed protein product [Ranitomeya imitator]|uniref:Alpha-2-macroglobulin domain-containing protein n=1 Tax=Ranitomeya imitator TaxID=111125 RepID=A0ABN9MIR4_9NEOB|nr:unnamed protein product [Ranitomeya imitator]